LVGKGSEGKGENTKRYDLLNFLVGCWFMICGTKKTRQVTKKKKRKAKR
jgi:hypothetical protein